ncbi:MAG: DUF6531 domain-containing protein [Candidatus Polarisedimenticolaceae bacterium]|nr:DUF6531 domain-containing protein [Candidatus Polarisedimenticolaceae bacterium]
MKTNKSHKESGVCYHLLSILNSFLNAISCKTNNQLWTIIYGVIFCVAGLPMHVNADDKLICITAPDILDGYCYPASTPGDEAFKSVCSMTGGITLDGAILANGYGSCYWHEGSHHFTNYHYFMSYDIGISEDNGTTCTAAGNPINYTTGNKFQTEQDFKAAGKSALHFTRYYNSQSMPQSESTLGAHWRHNFDYSLTIIGPDGGLKSVVTNHPDGKARIWSSINGSNTTRSKIAIYTSTFHEPEDPLHLQGYTPPHEVSESNTYASVAEPNTQLTQTTEGWLLVKADGQIEKYNAAGKITLITTSDGFSKHFTYSGGLLTVVEDHFGNKLTFTYDINNQIEILTLPDFTAISYRYDLQGRLVTVIYPDDTPTNLLNNPQKQYHYEKDNYPNALTGITNENGQRYASWDYDVLGRAISSEHANGVERFSFIYNGVSSTTNERSTTVINPLGKETTYRYKKVNGKNIVTQVTGHPSQDCAGANKSYDYDAKGYITSKTDWNGNTTVYARDDKGRELSRTEASGTADAHTVTTVWHATFDKPLRITQPKRIIEFSYDTSGNVLTRTESAVQ